MVGIQVEVNIFGVKSVDFPGNLTVSSFGRIVKHNIFLLPFYYVVFFFGFKRSLINVKD